MEPVRKTTRQIVKQTGPCLITWKTYLIVFHEVRMLPIYLEDGGREYLDAA